MKCCYETQRGCSVGGMHRFALSTAFMKHLLCAQHRLGPCHPPSQARMTSSSPGRVHSRGQTLTHWCGAAGRCLFIGDRRPYIKSGACDLLARSLANP